MTAAVVFRRNTAAAATIAEHLSHCDSQFMPPLSERVDISNYAARIAGQTVRFEAWSNDQLVALVAAYVNEQALHGAFITSVSVLPDWTARGIATRLMHDCIEYAKLCGAMCVRLEVAPGHGAAIHLYRKCGFAGDVARGSVLEMRLELKGSSQTMTIRS